MIGKPDKIKTIMCRFIAYQGCPEVMGPILFEPENSIIKQSYAATEIEEPLNGDGFGVGWYAPGISPLPGVFVSISPAWNNRNLRYISQKIKSNCMVAHVRAASVGAVSESNCHPFHYGRYLMMHNGGVEHFDRIKRSIVDRLSPEMYAWVQGQTDSEHFFALFLDKLMKHSANPSTEEIAHCLELAFADILGLMKGAGITDPAYFNLVVTEGEKMVGCRYVTHKDVQPLSLHHSESGKFVCENGAVSLVKDNARERGVMIASERLTNEPNDWKMVPEHHFVLVEENLKVRFRVIGV